MSDEARTKKQAAKGQIRELHGAIGEAIAAKDGGKTKKLRHQVKVLKRATRQLARKIKSAKPAGASGTAS